MSYWVIVCVWLVSSSAAAQPMKLEEGLTEAILDLTTTERRHLWWRPCGERFRGDSEEAHAYARTIAATIIREAGTDLDPWWMAAQLAQESGMNPCAFSNAEFARYRRALGRRPTERDVMALLRSSQLREEHGIRALDAGLAQFRYPGAVLRMVGIEQPEQLLDIDTSVRAFASALRLYRRRCDEHPVFSGNDTIERPDGTVRVVRWRYRCAYTFWAIHNSGSADRVRRQYIMNVQRRYDRGPARWRSRVESGLSETG